jgi:FMN phosphatase YigB (HAD superfamily)
LVLSVVQAFQLALEAAGAKAATTAFFDDSARNVAAGHAAGLFSVLVGTFDFDYFVPKCPSLTMYALLGCTILNILNMLSV